MSSVDREFELFQKMRQKTDEELFDVILAGNCDDMYAAAVQLTVRGNKRIFLKALEFCKSEKPAVRVEAARILGQLGTLERPFRKESIPVLIKLSENDPDRNVRASAAAALGHLGDPLAIPCLIKSGSDPDVNVRRDVAFALGCFGEGEVVKTLITLSSDSDEEVRNWATFSLGSCIEFDTDEIREALYARLSEKNPEIRGEAMLGLAKRQDRKVIIPLIHELSGEFYGDWAIEAAELMREALFYPYLVFLRERLTGQVENRFIKSVDNAISACKPSES